MQREAKLVATELDAVSSLFDGNLAFSEIRGRVLTSIQTEEARIGTEVAKGRAPREICLGAISQASRLEVVYGDHYAYRGILTFFGAHLFGVWKTAMGELVRMGHVSPEAFKERLAEMDAAIAETG